MYKRQLAFDLKNDSDMGYDDNDYEINIALWNDKPVLTFRAFGAPEPPGNLTKDAKVAIVRNEAAKTTVYELALPLRDMPPWTGENLKGKCVRFNFVVNDDDGKTARRTKWIGVTKGIAEAKKPSYFKNILFVE